MYFPKELLPGTLIKRYKRFLADICLENGELITVHCPNSGSMRGCSTPGSKVCLSISDNPGRKYRHTLEMIYENNGWIGVNPLLANKLVVEGIKKGGIPELLPFDGIRQEVKTSPGSRLDILLENGSGKTFVEVKSCSLAENNTAMFPDAVTARGTRHLFELARLVEEGHRGVIFFLVQRGDADCFKPAGQIDPKYAETLENVHHKGVEILVYQAMVRPEQIEIVKKLPFSFTSVASGPANI
ncbi:MAG: DNA/RNA nuclease SfsA [Deltaproteobacteria bacterium]|nr:MAG: DNA/RNA nuclease SfsA [Deltaproteobacteria bacterium]